MSEYLSEIIIFLFAVYGLSVLIMEVVDAIRYRKELETQMTVILKVCNQEEVIEGIIRKISKLKGQVRDFQLIVVDGGSIDDTVPILERLRGPNESFMLLSHQDRGLLFDVIENSPSKLVCYLDLECDLELIKHPAKLGKVLREIA